MEKITPNNRDLPDNTRKLKVLIAPLDWGLGHTTRCIPLAHSLVELGVTVFFAGNEQQKELLQREFPNNPFLHLAGYNIRYSKTAAGLTWKLATQLGRIRKTIRYEHDWLLQQAKEHGFDAVISDNRFGLWHPFIPSIFITHQLAIQTPVKWAQKLVQKINYRFIDRFSACWVPDMPGTINLAGVLSHPVKMPRIPVSYIGILSRLKPLQTGKVPGHLFVSLSGPEPQRSLLEKSILTQLGNYQGRVIVVRGLPGNAKLPPVPPHIVIHNHLDTAAYNQVLCAAGMVISRTGYSTVMDIMAAGQKSILIPTPGQTEQEYLAEYLVKKQLALCYTQQQFNLEESLVAAATFNYQKIPAVPIYKEIIAGFVKTLSGNKE